MSVRRIAFINEKGGTCKTTLAVNLAAYFAAAKKQRVLLVDLDTQGHAAKCLGIDVRRCTANVFHWLTDLGMGLEHVLQPTTVPGLTVVPSYKHMAQFPEVLAQEARRAHRLADRLDEVEGYFDCIVFDAPPSMGLATTNILVAASEVVVPVALTYLALDGCAEMVETISQTATDYHCSDLHVTLVVPTMYRKTELADEVLAKLRSHFPGRCAKQPLGMNVKIDEAQSHGQTIWEYAPWSRGATLLQAVAEEVWAAGPRAARIASVA